MLREADGAGMRMSPGCPSAWRADAQLGKIRQVVVPWASRRPVPSVSRPSAVPTRRPRLSTVPSALIRPVSGVIGRSSEILN